MLQLTPEQRAIVAHNKGPALVFAVAGAGKTTAMVHRIERLVREGIFPAKRILATSFSRSTVDDIKKALAPWPHCKAVQTSTLHAVGFRILQRAHQLGLTQLSADIEADPDQIAERLLSQTLQIARQQEDSLFEKSELRQIDRDDFLTYVSTCKGNLQYADLAKAHLPTTALSLASQALAPPSLPWYLDLYRIFEQHRLEAKRITFDDMLLHGWELLIRHDSLRAEFQDRYDCVIVDEFQDVNLAQSEMLDILIQRHRNYMVIGDDDQTIYEWRGAQPRYILEFADRYNAAKFMISDNFRCKASQVVLANEIISHNRLREQKTLHLTRGFDGRTFVHLDESIAEMGRRIVHEIQRALERGYTLKEITILVRLYAQTPSIEHPLIEADIPYKVVGSQPFYQRPEIRVLLAYLKLARWNARLLEGKALPPQEFNDLSNAWRQIVNRPLRYVSAESTEQILQDVSYHRLPFNLAIQKHLNELRSWQARHLEELRDNLLWLSTHFAPQHVLNAVSSAHTPLALLPPQEEPCSAAQILHELELRLDYKRFLLRSSGFPETGEGRARNIDSFLDYADGKGTPEDFLQHIEKISFEGKRHRDKDDLLSIMTIFRAKGLEWPVVFIPDCNDGTIPFRGQGNPNVEEERRLLYVAITRTKKELHLCMLRKARPSSFLIEADYIQTLQIVEKIRAVLESEPHTWDTEHLLTVARHTHRLQLDRYLSFWWETHSEQKIALARKIQEIFRYAQKKQWLRALQLDEEHLSFWEEFGFFDEEPDVTSITEIARFAKEALPTEVIPSNNTDLNTSPFIRREEVNANDFSIGMRLRHPSFGIGVVDEIFEVNGNLRLSIDFGALGRRRIAPKFVKLERL